MVAQRGHGQRHTKTGAKSVGDMSREPSMEEILSSIRRVIARDEAARDDKLEQRFGGSTDSADAGAPAVDDILDLTEIDATPAIAADGPATDAASAPAEEVQQDTESPLVSPQSVDATRQSISQLTAALAEGQAAPAADSALPAGMTIEALAEAALKPMLKAWLDQNLPPLVERLVAREIARITGDRV
jgi:cell pole-organizing protein PopZ